MPDLPKFKPGTQANAIPAAQMQAMSDEAAALRAFRATLPLKLTRGHKTLTLSIDPARIPMAPSPRTVVITEIKTHTMIVKAVRYKALPPLQCIGEEPAPECGIEVIDDAFVAYPDYGKKPSDYTGMTYAAPISASTQYARCVFEHGVWVVQMGGGGGGGSIPVSIIAADVAGKIKVQPLKWNEDGTALLDDGEQIVVKTWPDRPNTDYTPFVGKPDIFQLVNLVGQPCVYHHIRFTQTEPPAGVTFGGCA